MSPSTYLTHRTPRYNASKLLEVFYCRVLATKMTESAKPAVTLNFTNPGLCSTELSKEGGWRGLLFSAIKILIARTAEVGSRTLVAGGVAGPDSHGQYLSDSKVCQ